MRQFRTALLKYFEGVETCSSSNILNIFPIQEQRNIEGWSFILSVE